MDDCLGENDFCYHVCVQGTFVAMAIRRRAVAPTTRATENNRALENNYGLLIKDLASGWTRRVYTRGYLMDMAWTTQGNLVAACGKALFLVGGPPQQRGGNALF